NEEHGWLEDILPRKSECLRPPVANVSLLLIVVAPTPAPDLLLVDRMMIRARQQGMKLALVVNKCDLAESLADALRKQYAGAELPVFAVSALENRGLAQLREHMIGELCCLTGQSGVGKSTLLNHLLGLELETGEISQKIQRGKNTTRHAELLLVDGLRVLDTAGFSLLELDAATEPITLKSFYPEFAQWEGQCRFNPCYHDREPGCAVTAACQAGSMDEQRLERYRQLLQEVRQTWKERYD
ncbi:MAG: ribosome small subunit-dependent GTPase A, partial [Aristaeellaceae bacterium]